MAPSILPARTARRELVLGINLVAIRLDEAMLAAWDVTTDKLCDCRAKSLPCR